MGTYKITEGNLKDILKWSGFTLKCVSSDHGDYHAVDTYAWTKCGVEVSTNSYIVNVYKDPSYTLTGDDDGLGFEDCDAVFIFKSGNTRIETKNFDLFVSILESECRLEYEERFPLIEKLKDDYVSALNMKRYNHNETCMKINGHTSVIRNTPKALEAIQNFCLLFFTGVSHE